MTSPRKPVYSAPALEKGLDIIELLSRQESGLTQSEIARGLDRSVGEIFRMLMVLLDRGYVAQDPVSDRYVLTTYIFEVANRIPIVGRLTAAAMPLMHDVSARINQSTHLAVLNKTGVLIIAQAHSPDNYVMSLRLGARVDLWRASSGRVIVAFQSEDEIARLMREVPLPDTSPASQVLDELARIREAGLEMRDSFVVKGVVNISVPIFDHSGRAIAALTVPHIERIDDTSSFQQCKEELLRTAALLSKALGGQPPVLALGHGM